MPRKFFWIKIKVGTKSSWQPAELIADRWYEPGWEFPIDKEDIIEIGEELTHKCKANLELIK